MLWLAIIFLRGSKLVQYIGTLLTILNKKERNKLLNAKLIKSSILLRFLKENISLVVKRSIKQNK